MTLLLISLGAFVGAPARYLTDRSLRAKYGQGFPWGTFAVNVIASLLLGVLLGAGSGINPRVIELVGTGFCGALSTYSTFSYETLRLYQDDSRLAAIIYVTLTLICALAAAAAGWALGAAFC